MIRDLYRIETMARAAMADMRFGEPATRVTSHAAPASGIALVALLAGIALAGWLLIP